MSTLSTTDAIVFGIFATMTYDVMSTTNSSPQTTELNAAARSPTLMKWVTIGLAQAALFAGIGIAIEIKSGRPWWPAALGSGLAGTLLYAQYEHARRAGTRNPGTPTENYS